MKVPRAGVWCPAVTFFDPTTQRLDLSSQKQYFHYLSTTGLAGLVILGSNAETFLLRREERKTLITLARSAVGPDFPLICGVSGFSVVQTLEYIQDAVDAGADFGLLLPAAYYGASTTKEVVMAYYDEIAQKGGLPIVIYNFPGICNGVDMDSETIATLAKRNPGKIVGVKLTCGSVAKVTRLTAELSPDVFSTFGGQSDFLIGALASGSQGCVAAFSNVFPKTIVRIYDSYLEGKMKEALELHRKAALAESPVKAGIASTKFAVSQYSAVAAGIEGAEEKLKPRRPYVPVSDAVKDNVRRVMDGLAEIEKTL
ncbi:dihydrodipicolinate synthetase family protein-like protein [Sporormia fimetaria CBS 119925]|uniref:Dihydrodipicolinate synthetase family protein-like protein n=1 Tax=Sporormia fimetaria CBS 119925 TaxID=1340428 RepID=A0A6A6VMG0_9PLEO|nr:dihydrodipicolinate synthetase family protein-like protein [Sporormia fimetaria CBS 119925]